MKKLAQRFVVIVFLFYFSRPSYCMEAASFNIDGSKTLINEAIATGSEEKAREAFVLLKEAIFEQSRLGNNKFYIDLIDGLLSTQLERALKDIKRIHTNSTNS